ncbi:MAG: hypothetical protein NTW32_13435, partial [Chloroflexi bacterium]|nr:hypothetical protein [Chloroflexota bacterium]
MNNYQNKWQQIIYSLKNQIFLLFFLVLHIFIIKSFILLSMDTLYGDFSATQLVPAPLYNTMRLEVSEFNAINRLSADFSQIYFPLKELSSLKERHGSETQEVRLTLSEPVPVASAGHLGFGSRPTRQG